MIKRTLVTLVIFYVVSLLLPNGAGADEFGIVSESLVYPDGLRLDVDSKLQLWHNIMASDDFADRREGDKSFKCVIPQVDWFGFGVIWDPNDDDIADPKDMAVYSSGSLKFWVKTETPIDIGIKDTSVERWVNISAPPFNIPSDNQWRFVSIPMDAYFGDIDFSEVTQLFMVRQSSTPTDIDFTFHLDNVRWDTTLVGPLDTIAVYPPAWTIPAGLPKSFIATGYDSDSKVVDIYPTWSTSGINGTLGTAEGRQSIFTPDLTPGSGTITALDGAFSGNAAIQVEDIIWNDFFNLFIDGGLYGSIGAYDSDDGDADGDGIENNSIELEFITLGTPPGSGSAAIEATCSVTNTGWAGFFLQEGELTDDVSIRDVSGFQDGYIHFWIKAPVDVEISLRTNNIAAGDERSKLTLSEYGIPADSNWQEVYIALDDFKVRDNRIDFTLAKIFFHVSLAGERVGTFSGTFLLNDIRYVRRRETTPTFSIAIKRRLDDQIEPSGKVTWSGAGMGTGWEIADQYLEIVYDSPDPTWGAQIYTDNMSQNASPRYNGEPSILLHQQPAGLVGDGDSRLTCPMAWMALNSTNPDVPVPVEIEAGLTKAFQSDMGGMWGAAGAESEWSWLKDVSSTVWAEDTDGDEYPDPDEIIQDFSLTGDSYSTFINQSGISTGWYNADGTQVYILNPESPVVVYLAADFKRATVIQKYKTNTLTVELYHQ